METEEQIVRAAKAFGNGAHIFVPKEWIGQKIFVIRQPKKSLKEKIIEAVEPALDSVVGVYLYGSHARSEEQEDSDIDLFVITDKKIKIKKEGFEILCIEEKDMPKAIAVEPVIMYSILSEAKAIMNARLLEELRLKHKPRLSSFTDYLRDCQRVIKINEEFLESEKGSYISGDAVVYSLMLRLRGIFIIRSLLKNKRYFHDRFKEWMSAHVRGIDFDSIYEAYRSAKKDEEMKKKVRVSDLKKLLGFLKKEVILLKDGQKRKKA